MKKSRKKKFTGFLMETKTGILLEIYIRVVVINVVFWGGKNEDVSMAN